MRWSCSIVWGVVLCVAGCNGEDTGPTVSPDASCALDALDVSPSADAPAIRVVFDVALPATSPADNGIATIGGTESTVTVVTVSASYLLSGSGKVESQALHAPDDPLRMRAYVGWTTQNGVAGVMVAIPLAAGGFDYLFCTLAPGSSISPKQCSTLSYSMRPIGFAAGEEFRLYRLDVDFAATGLTEAAYAANGTVISGEALAPASEFLGYGYDTDLVTVLRNEEGVTAITSGATADQYCPTMRVHTLDDAGHSMTVLVPSHRERVRNPGDWTYAHDDSGRAAFLYATSCMENQCADDNIPNADVVTHLRLYEPGTGWSEHLSRGTNWTPEVMFYDGATVVTIYKNGAFEDATLVMTRFVDGVPREVKVPIPHSSIGGSAGLNGVHAGAAIGPDDYLVGYTTIGAEGHVMRLARFQVE